MKQDVEGEFFADYDENSKMYCVFFTDDTVNFKSGHAYSSWATLEQAEKHAYCRNMELHQRRADSKRGVVNEDN